MGCGPHTAKYRIKHIDALRYLLEELHPDIALIQEALFSTSSFYAHHGSFHWSEDHTSDSGTAVFVRKGIKSEREVIQSEGSFLAGANINTPEGSLNAVSIHVGPGDYKRNVHGVFNLLENNLNAQHFIAGGDLNAARHLDDVYGGTWYHRLFNSLVKKGFYDCHWAVHGKEIQSFWGLQTREAYQDDHMFIDVADASAVIECKVIDSPLVREFSDHGPLLREIKDL
jgi:exonuclease III